MTCISREGILSLFSAEFHVPLATTQFVHNDLSRTPLKMLKILVPGASSSAPSPDVKAVGDATSEASSEVAAPDKAKKKSSVPGLAAAAALGAAAVAVPTAIFAGKDAAAPATPMPAASASSAGQTGVS